VQLALENESVQVSEDELRLSPAGDLKFDALSLRVGLAEGTFDGVGNVILEKDGDVAAALARHTLRPVLAILFFLSIIEDVGHGRQGHFEFLARHHLQFNLLLLDRPALAVKPGTVDQLDIAVSPLELNRSDAREVEFEYIR